MTLTRKELSRSRLNDWVSIAELGLFVVHEEGCQRDCPGSICVLWPESFAHEVSDHLYFGGRSRGGSRIYEGHHAQKPTRSRAVRAPYFDCLERLHQSAEGRFHQTRLLISSSSSVMIGTSPPTSPSASSRFSREWW